MKWSILLSDGTTYVGLFVTEADADDALKTFGFTDAEVVEAKYDGTKYVPDDGGEYEARKAEARREDAEQFAPVNHNEEEPCE